MTIVARVEQGIEAETVVNSSPQIDLSVGPGAKMVTTEIAYGDGKTAVVYIPGSAGPQVEARKLHESVEVQVPGSARVIVGVMPRDAQNAIDEALLIVRDGRDFVFQTAASVGDLRNEVRSYRDDVLNGMATVDSVVQTRLSEWGTTTQNAIQQQLQTFVLTNYYTINATNVAIAGAIEAFGSQVTSDISQVTATLVQDYYTAAQTDQAISSATLALKSQLEGPGGSIGQVTALLDTDYFTSAQTNQAISAASTSLLSQIQSLGGGGPVYHFGDDSRHWTSTVAGAPRDVGPVDARITFRTDLTRRLLVGPVGAFTGEIGVWTKEVIACIPGNAYRVKVTARSLASATSQMRIALARLDGSYAFLTRNLLTPTGSAMVAGTEFTAYTFDFTMPLGTTAAFVRGGVIFDGTQTPLTTPIDISTIETLDITPVQTLRASLDTDFYTRAGTDAAIASATTQLEADVDGLVASVTTQQTALTTLQDNASATLSFRTQAGSGGALLELISNANPAGAVSVARIAADNIILDGSVRAKHIDAESITASKLAVGDVTNLFPDFEMLDPAFYASSTGTVFTFLDGVAGSTGRRIVNIPSSAAAASVETGWAACEGGADYLVEGAAWLATSGQSTTALLEIELGSVAPDGTVTPTRRVVVDPLGSSTGTARQSVVVTTTSAERRFRFVASKNAVSGSSVRFGGLLVRRRMGATLIADGSITTEKINVASLSAISANIGLLRSAVSGARVEIENDRISVFRADGSLAVRLGRLV